MDDQKLIEERLAKIEKIQDKMESDLKTLMDLLNDLELKAKGLK